MQSETVPENQDTSTNDDNEVRALHVQLVPPVGTSYFSRETLTIFNNKSVTRLGSTSAGTITWKADVYKYATGAQPSDPNFPSQGEIVLIFIHSGSVNLGKIHYERRFSITPGYSGVSAVVQDPKTYSGVQNGDNWDYTIDYKETFPMFKNNGQEATTFEAVYYETFTRNISQQTGFVTPDGQASFFIQYQKKPADNTTFHIKGLSVFKCRQPSAFPMNFNFKYLSHLNEGPGKDTYSAEANASLRVNLDF